MPANWKTFLRLRRTANFQFAIVLLLALVGGGLTGSAFAVRRATVQRTHHRHFRWLLLESDV
jgi:hypothetical protein